MDTETKSFIKEEIESLGIMITKAFDFQQKSIEAVEGKLGAVEGRLDAVEGRLGTVEGRIETVRQELTSEIQDVKERLTAVETKIDRETEMLVVMENNLMDRDLASEDRTQQVLHRVERIEDHLKLSHSLEPA